MFPNTYNTKTKQVKTIRLQVTFFFYDIEYQIKIHYHIIMYIFLISKIFNFGNEEL